MLSLNELGHVYFEFLSHKPVFPVTEIGNLTVVTNNPPLKGARVEGGGGGEGGRGVVLQLLIASLLLEKLHVIDL